MNLLETLSKKAETAGLHFLIIGGYAVMAHGFVRSTADLDLLVRKALREDWRRLLEGLGMTLFVETPTFSQFNPTPEFAMPLDMMFVEDAVFDRMQAESEKASVQGVTVGVVSLLHLIALKCHSFRHGREGRRFKDIEDMIHLIKINRIDLNDTEVRATILKHGTEELYGKLRRACVPD
jgi:hypothetical protein